LHLDALVASYAISFGWSEPTKSSTTTIQREKRQNFLSRQIKIGAFFRGAPAQIFSRRRANENCKQRKRRGLLTGRSIHTVTRVAALKFFGALFYYSESPMAGLFKGKFGIGKKSGHSQQSRKSSGGPPSSSASSEAGDDVLGVQDQIMEQVPPPTVTMEPQIPREKEQEGGVSELEREANSGFGLGPTVQISSIFSGLQLSNKVAKEEASDSPYISSQGT